MTSATPQQAAEVLHEAAEAIAVDVRIAPGARLVCASILDAAPTLSSTRAEASGERSELFTLR